MEISKEQNNKIMQKIEEEIVKRKLQWCQDSTEFVSGLLLGMEVAINTLIPDNKQIKDETNEEN